MHTFTISQFVPVKQQTGKINVSSTVSTPIRSVKKLVTVPRVALNPQAYLRAITAVLVVSNVVLLGIHIVRANAYAITGYEITGIRQKISTLTEENKKLSLRLAEGNSIAQVETTMKDQNFVPITTTEFIRPVPTKITQR